MGRIDASLCVEIIENSRRSHAVENAVCGRERLCINQCITKRGAGVRVVSF